jgi:hypothetical protein
VGDFAIFIWMEKLSPRFKRHIFLLLIVLPVLVVSAAYDMQENGFYRLPKPALELIWYTNLLIVSAGWCGYLYWNVRVFNSEPLIDKITSPVKVIIAGGIAAFIIYACWLII